jgi:hypothetical protein
LEHRTILDRTVNKIANLYLLALPEEYHENPRIDSVLIYIPQAPFGHKTGVLPLCLPPLLLLGAFAKHLQTVRLRAEISATFQVAFTKQTEQSSS